MGKEKSQGYNPEAAAAEVAEKSRESLKEQGVVSGVVETTTDANVAYKTFAPKPATDATTAEEMHVQEKMEIGNQMRAAGWFSFYSRSHNSLVWKSPEQLVFEAQQETIPPDAAIRHFQKLETK